MKIHNWRQIPADPIDPALFAHALEHIARSFSRTAGSLAPALGQTRLLVPLTLFLRQEYRQEQIVSILLRLQALQALVQDGTLESWIVSRSEDGALAEVRGVIVEAAATAPLDGEDRFDAEQFLELVEQRNGKTSPELPGLVQIPVLGDGVPGEANTRVFTPRHRATLETPTGGTEGR